ncbi:hypothetical protein RP300_01235 [Oligella urethralis]|nr:hypothetical protein RP300_01235 [Oligella urethralis]
MSRYSLERKNAVINKFHSDSTLSLSELARQESNYISNCSMLVNFSRYNNSHLSVPKKCNDPVKTCSGLNLILWRKFDHEYRDEVRESSLDSQA